MSNDEFERRMQFILDQQAQFAAGIQKLEEAQVETDAKIRALATVSLSFAEHIETLARHLADIDRRLASLVSETNARFQATDEKIRTLVDSQAHTDQRMDALIDIIRREKERGNPGQ
jgi:hypothetical protein